MSEALCHDKHKVTPIPTPEESLAIRLKGKAKELSSELSKYEKFRNQVAVIASAIKGRTIYDITYIHVSFNESHIEVEYIDPAEHSMSGEDIHIPMGLFLNYDYEKKHQPQIYHDIVAEFIRQKNEDHKKAKRQSEKRQKELAVLELKRIKQLYPELLDSIRDKD